MAMLVERVTTDFLPFQIILLFILAIHPVFPVNIDVILFAPSRIAIVYNNAVDCSYI
jgi:hypothetical protein